MFAKLVQISLEVLLRWSSKEKKLQMSYLQQLILFPFLIYLKRIARLKVLAWADTIQNDF